MADWQTMETAPRFIRPDNTNYGPLFWGLIPYSPLNQPDVCWWNDRAKCFEHTGQDGLNDIQRGVCGNAPRRRPMKQDYGNLSAYGRQ
jgi:hypothetical protein